MAPAGAQLRPDARDRVGEKPRSEERLEREGTKSTKDARSSAYSKPLLLGVFVACFPCFVRFVFNPCGSPMPQHLVRAVGLFHCGGLDLSPLPLRETR